jgi:rod shape-determining protein MreC
VQPVSPLRSRLFAAAVLVGQLFLLAAQAPDRAAPGGERSLLAGLALRAVAPLASAVDAAGDAVTATGAALATRDELERENERLRAELRELRRGQLRLSELELESAALARGLDYARHEGLALRAARVVYLDRHSWLRTLVVRAGAAGARLDQVVMTDAGVVGRVIETSGPWAKVQLVTDRAAALGAYLETARRQGIARGTAPDELELDNIPRQVEVAPGDRVLTAGIDGVYPRGLPVGVVTAVEPGSEMFHRIRVRPSVDFAELGVVYLLDRETPPRPAPSEGSGGGR